MILDQMPLISLRCRPHTRPEESSRHFAAASHGALHVLDLAIPAHGTTMLPRVNRSPKPMDSSPPEITKGSIGQKDLLRRSAEFMPEIGSSQRHYIQYCPCQA
jgi:hypothetical protein